MTFPVLIVEDDETLKSVMSLQLKRCGFDSLIATDGIEALDLLSKHKVSMILMDVQMPHMDGLEATRAIRDREAEGSLPRTPIIAVTAHPDSERCYDAGMDDFLFKPILIGEIEKVLARWIVES